MSASTTATGTSWQAIMGRENLVSLPERCVKFLSGKSPSSPEALRQYAWKHNVLPNLEAAHLPERYRHELLSWQPKQKTAYEKCNSLLNRTGAVLALIGPRGTGKTTIAAQIVIDRAKDDTLQPWEQRPPYRKLTDLIAKLKPIYSDFGSLRAEELVRYRNNFCNLHPLIVIDEIHECQEQHVKERLLTDLIDRRYAARTDTILISNQTLDEFKRVTNPSTLSRLEEHGGIIVCDWKSFRTVAREARQLEKSAA